MYYVIGASVSSLHRESTDSLIHVLYVCADSSLSLSLSLSHCCSHLQDAKRCILTLITLKTAHCTHTRNQKGESHNLYVEEHYTQMYTCTYVQGVCVMGGNTFGMYNLMYHCVGCLWWIWLVSFSSLWHLSASMLYA